MIAPVRSMKRQRTENLPNKLRKLRLKHGFTLARLARILDVSMQALRQAEIHGNGIGKDKWYKLADLFDIDPRDLESP